MPSESAFRDAPGNGPGLIETFRYEPGTGFLRLEAHLGRMARSAEALGLVFSMERALEALHPVTGPSVLRVRLLLSSEGSFGLTTASFTPTAPDTVWRLRLARARLSSTDPLLRHKTTRREVYEQARAEFPPDEAGEVVLCNEEGQVCEGTVTNIFVRDRSGAMRTPAARCGLLPGILRQTLLASGAAKEAVLETEDLLAAEALFVGNSLRGLVRARLERP